LIALAFRNNALVSAVAIKESALIWKLDVIIHYNFGKNMSLTFAKCIQINVKNAVKMRVVHLASNVMDQSSDGLSLFGLHWFLYTFS
jgi:hypothetical protein